VLDQSQDVFGEGKEMGMTAPKQTAGMRQRAAMGYGAGTTAQQGGRPTAEGVFQGQQGQTAAAGAAGAAAGTIIVTSADDGDDGN
jgi:hypothetical protein